MFGAKDTGRLVVSRNVVNRGIENRSSPNPVCACSLSDSEVLYQCTGRGIEKKSIVSSGPLVSSMTDDEQSSSFGKVDHPWVVEWECCDGYGPFNTVWFGNHDFREDDSVWLVWGRFVVGRNRQVFAIASDCDCSRLQVSD